MFVSIPHSGHPSFRRDSVKGSLLVVYRFPSRIRATPHSDKKYPVHLGATWVVSIPHSGHPSFRPRIVTNSFLVLKQFPSRIRATPHSDLSCYQDLFTILISFHPAFGPPLIQTAQFEQVVKDNFSVSIPHSGHPSFRPHDC